MPLVRMLTSLAGERVTWLEGEEIDMTPAEAQVFADGERGELVTDDPALTPERRGRRMERRG